MQLERNGGNIREKKETDILLMLLLAAATMKY